MRFLYVGFLLSERGYVSDKIVAMFPAGTQASETDRMLSAISDGIRRYIWIKSLISILTGALS